MESPIIAKFRISLKDWKSANYYHFVKIYHHKLFLYGNIFIGLALLFEYFNLWYKHAWSSGFAAIIYMLTLFWAFYYFSMYWGILYRYKTFPQKEMEFEWKLDSNTVSGHSPVTTSEMKWSFFIKGVRTPIGLMLYYNKFQFYLLPTHGFSSPAEYERAIELVKRKINEFKEVGR